MASTKRKIEPKPDVGFDWDDANITHIAKHDVKAHEAEEVVTNDPIDLTVTIRNGEERMEQLGETAKGRVLQVVTTFRNGRIRVVTALPLRRRWHAWYFELKENRNARDKNIP